VVWKTLEHNISTPRWAALVSSNRFRITTWMAFADFFAAISLLMLSHYAVQRRKVIQISKPIKDFASELHKQLSDAGVPHEWDPRQSWISLPDNYFLLTKADWHITDQGRVELLANALKNALRKSSSGWDTGAFRFYLLIRGHADARPMGGMTNLELSRLRARELEKDLGAYGVGAPEFQVSSQGVGETEPLVDNCAQPHDGSGYASKLPPCPGARFASDDRLSVNRRIELRFGVFAAK
jgi:hypothetical protein